MLFMVIERFRSGRPDEVGHRFRERGRLLVEGAEYLDSWMIADGSACFQLMRADTLAHLQPWLDAWSDLVDFEVTPIETSSEFWLRHPAANE